MGKSCRLPAPEAAGRCSPPPAGAWRVFVSTRMMDVTSTQLLASPGLLDDYESAAACGGDPAAHVEDFAHQMRWLMDGGDPRVVMDNLNTHRPASLYETFPAPEARRIAKRLEFHYTPKHGSWLNMAEIEFSVLSRSCLKQAPRRGDAPAGSPSECRTPTSNPRRLALAFDAVNPDDNGPDMVKVEGWMRKHQKMPQHFRLRATAAGT